MTVGDLSSGAFNPDDRFRRQLGFFNPSEHPDASVTFVGVGGIGSFAAFATAKLGVPNLMLIDMDTVEEHNAPNQFHAVDQIGTSKVEALASEIQAHVGTGPNFLAGPLADYDDYRGVVVSGLDSMAARQELWDTKLKYNPNAKLYIDGRIAGELILIYTLCPYDPADVEAYEKTLHSDDDAEPASCTERGIIDIGFMIGSLITRQIRKYYSRDELDKTIYVTKNLSIMKGGWM